MSTDLPDGWASRWNDHSGDERAAGPTPRRRIVTHLVLVDGLPADHWVEESADGSWERRAGRRRGVRAAGDPSHVHALRWLEAAAGGAEALRTLDAAPLPDEPFDVDVVPAQRLDRVRAVSERCDEVAHEVFGEPELAPALRHVLQSVLAADPGTLARSDRDDALVGALAWIGGHANGLIGPGTDLLARDLWRRLAVTSSAASRGAALLRRLGAQDLDPLPQWGSPHLRAIGMPRALTGRTRAVLLARRDAAWADLDATRLHHTDP